MKKFTKIITLLLAVAMLFSGCVTVEMNTKIKSDGTGNIITVAEYDKSEYDAYCINKAPDLYSTPEDVEAAMIKEYENKTTENGASVKLDIVTKEDGKKYYVVTQTTSFKFTDEEYYSYVNHEGEFYGLYDDYMTKDTAYFTFDGDECARIIALMDSIDTSAEYDISKGKFTYTVEFPSNIVSSQGGKIDATNPKKITFDFPITGGAFTAFATIDPDVSISKVKAHISKIKSENEDTEKTAKVNKPKIKSIKVKTVKKKKGCVLLKWSKVKDAKYEVQYSTSKKLKKKVTKTKKIKKTSVAIKNLKKGKKYYFRVRAYKVIDEKKVYSKYSNKKSIKVVKKNKKK